MTLQEELSRKLARVSRVSSVVGEFVTMVGQLARVNVQGSTVEIRCDGWNPPIPGMPVRVETVNGIMRVTGPAVALPARGVVTESLDGGTRARVSAGGQTFDLPVMAPYSPVVSDVVVLNWQSGHVLGEEAAAPVDTTPDTPAASGTAFRNLLVQAHSSGKYDHSFGNWWGAGDLRASNNNSGLWFYENRFTVLAGATIRKVQIFLPTPWKSLGSLVFGFHAHRTRPGGAPSFSSTTPAPAKAGWVNLPVAWGVALRDNPHCGIGIVQLNPSDNQYPGVPQNGMSGALRFSGSR